MYHAATDTSGLLTVTTAVNVNLGLIVTLALKKLAALVPPLTESAGLVDPARRATRVTRARLDNFS